MRVVILSPYAGHLIPTITAVGDTYEVFRSDPETFPVCDIIVSFGYKHLIKEPILSIYKDRIFNIHISILPWNRGADPNFWSWFDDTPKGVSIHKIDSGIDTGEVVVQENVVFAYEGIQTLFSSWSYLIARATSLFDSSWGLLRYGNVPSRKQSGLGTYHRMSDKDKWFNLLFDGWNSPVSEVQRMGDKWRNREATKAIDTPQSDVGRDA